jgi:hypothetical protein
MPDPRQITQLPVATEADDFDLLLMRQGLFDKQVEVNLIRAGLARVSNNLSDIPNPAAARANLNVVEPFGIFLEISKNLSDVPNPATARSNLGVVEPFGIFLEISKNLSDVPNKATARTNLSVAELSITALKNATNDFNFNLQQKQQIQNYSEKVHAQGNISGSTSLNLTNGNVFTATLTGSATINITNPASSGQASSAFLILNNGGSSAITWNSSIKWSKGTAPTLTASGTDALVFVTSNGGTTWYGALAGVEFA